MVTGPFFDLWIKCENRYQQSKCQSYNKAGASEFSICEKGRCQGIEDCCLEKPQGSIESPFVSRDLRFKISAG